MVSPSLTWQKAVPPGGAAVYTGEAIPEWKGSLLVGTLASKHLERIVFDPYDPRHVVQHETYLQGDVPSGYGRLRDVVMGMDGQLYVTTSNCDGRGTCPPESDVILRITR
jgi:glucose/arabinose dehydrogenase